jgi:hypothetical protein
MSSTNRFSPEKDTASTTYKSAQTSIYSPRTKRLLKKIKRSSLANPAWKSTSNYAQNLATPTFGSLEDETFKGGKDVMYFLKY